MVPLDAIARFKSRATATSINHQNTDLAATVSYNLAQGATLSDSAAAIRNAENAIGMIVNGFCKEVFRELPMEFAVEAQKLLGVSLEGSVG